MATTKPKRRISASSKKAALITKWTNRYIKMDRAELRENPPTKAALRLDVGITTDVIARYNKDPLKHAAFVSAYKKATDFIVAYYERSLLRGGNHLTGVIFLLKTTCGYREQKQDEAQVVNITLDLTGSGKDDNAI